jgi:hypothetical protein
VEQTDTNKPCGLTISFINQITLLFRCQRTEDSINVQPAAGCFIKARSAKLSCHLSSDICHLIFGGHSGEVPPVPIPNTEVKLSSADGTARATVWESRSPPNSSAKPPWVTSHGGFFLPRQAQEVSRRNRKTLGHTRAGASAIAARESQPYRSVQDPIPMGSALRDQAEGFILKTLNSEPRTARSAPVEGFVLIN